MRGGEILLGGPLQGAQLAPVAGPFDSWTVYGMATTDGYTNDLQLGGTVGLLPAPDVLRWDPVINLDGNQPLILEGNCRRTFTNGISSRSVLHLAFHTWEFQDLSVMPSPQQQQDAADKQRAAQKGTK